jgi:carbonic anhydrase
MLLAGIALLSCKQDQNVQEPEINSDCEELTNLMEGNERFQKRTHGDVLVTSKIITSRQIKEASAQTQHPKAVVISCSDSRVPPEFIFDEGLGELFVIRTAGNIMGNFELGSIEYAVKHLGVKLIVVLGHTNCGAIKAFLTYDGHPETDHIQDIINYIDKEPEEIELRKQGLLDMDHAVQANVMHGVHLLRVSDPIIAEAYKSKDLKIVGAVYRIDAGIVEFLDE